MIVGIVGSEAAKFTNVTEESARLAIRNILNSTPATGCCSGECHLGGIDQWAREEAERMGIPFTPYAPAKQQWEGGYKQRNLQIARASDVCVCISVSELPEGYKGMRFAHCYHCKANDHVKSGGCWTVKQAVKMGKQGILYIIYPDGSRDLRGI